MKSKVSGRLSAYFLLLAVSFLITANPFVPNAQSNTVSLSGTKWAWVLPVDYGTGTLHCFYSFEDGQKVIRRVIAIAGDRLKLGIDNNMLLFYGTNTLTINHVPPAISVKERIGKYTQNGNSLTLEFSDSPKAQVLTYDKDKGLWSDKNDATFPKIGKISPAANQTPSKPAASESNGTKLEPESYPNVVRNAEGKLHPANGYRWINPKDTNDFRVELMPGLIKNGDGLRPDKGYRWVNPKGPNDFRVERIP